MRGEERLEFMPSATFTTPQCSGNRTCFVNPNRIPTTTTTLEALGQGEREGNFHDNFCFETAVRGRANGKTLSYTPTIGENSRMLDKSEDTGH